MLKRKSDFEERRVKAERMEKVRGLGNFRGRGSRGNYRGANGLN
jgi:hypothetical protein